jgi:hypothetical protein
MVGKTRNADMIPLHPVSIEEDLGMGVNDSGR